MTPLEESNRQLLASLRIFCGRFPTSEITRLPGIIALFGNVPVGFFNMCILAHPVKDRDSLRRSVAAAVDHAVSRKCPWMLHLCEEWLPKGAGKVCAEFGLNRTMRLIGMAADGLLPLRRPLPKLDYRRVNDDAACRSIASINIKAYGMAPEVVPHLASPAIWEGGSYPYLGCVNGEPVTCSATLPIEDRLYVGWVATLPGHQRKGYAEAVMRHSLAEAVRGTGFKRTVLHSSEAGYPLYRAMGYRDTAHFTIYTTPPAQ